MRTKTTSRWSVLGAVLITLTLAGAAAAQDWRGVGRLAGKVTDESGAPIADATVKAELVGSSGGPTVKTNKKGEFVFAGIAGGSWNLDVTAPGYEPARGSAALQEHSTNPPITLKLKKAPIDPNVQIKNDLTKAADLMKQQKYGEARALYADILAKHPDAWQVEPYIARTYYEQRQYDQAVQHLQSALQHDPEDIDTKLLLASVYNAQGKKDDAKQIVSSIDESKISDPTVLLNIGINAINDKHPEEAIGWFDKTVARFPQYAAAYYYRGITEVQLAKPDQAKADLEKFVQMAPDAPEAATAKGILAQLGK